MSTTENTSLSTAHRSAAAIGVQVEKHLTRLAEAANEVDTTPVSEQALVEAEAQVVEFNRYLDKLKDAVDKVHEIMQLPTDDILTEKYYMLYDKLDDRSFAFIKKITAARRLTIEADEKARRDELHKAQLAALQAQNQVPDGNATAPLIQSSQTKFQTTLKPEKLELDASIADFRNFRTQFEDYYAANKMERLPIREQRAHLRSCLDTKVQDTVKHLLEVKDDAHVNDVLEALNRHFSESLKLMTRRLHFNQCSQKAGENFSDYLVRLRLLGDCAELDALPYEEVLASHIVANVNSKELQKELLKMDNQDFKSVKTKCLSWEASERNQSSMTNTTSDVKVNKISSYKAKKKSNLRENYIQKNQDDERKSNDGESSLKCRCCGYSYHKGGFCPAKNSICGHCGLKGHYESVCEHKRRELKDSKEKHVKTNAVYCRTIRHSRKSTPLANVEVAQGGKDWKDVFAIPDTGTGYNLINKHLLKSLGMKYSPRYTRRIYAVNGRRLHCNGSARIKIAFNNREIEAFVYVTPHVSDFLISWPTMIELGMISRSFPKSCSCLEEENQKDVQACRESSIDDSNTEDEASTDTSDDESTDRQDSKLLDRDFSGLRHHERLQYSRQACSKQVQPSIRTRVLNSSAPYWRGDESKKETEDCARDMDSIKVGQVVDFRYGQGRKDLWVGPGVVTKVCGESYMVQHIGQNIIYEVFPQDIRPRVQVLQVSCTNEKSDDSLEKEEVYDVFYHHIFNSNDY